MPKRRHRHRLRLALRALPLALLLASAPPPPAAAQPDPTPNLTPNLAPDLAPVRAWRAAHGHEVLARFAELLAIPNLASDAEHIAENAEWLREELLRRGARAELWTLPGAPPVVWGELPASIGTAAASARTLGIYFHYDGQPVTPAQWTRPPWQPALLTAALEAGGTPRPFPAAGEAIDPEWRIYARSAGDDKAPAAALFAALDALAASGLARTSNLVFLFEGEEEAGSPHLPAYMEAHRAALDAASAWLIFDGPVHPSRRPQLVFGVRGVTGLSITVYGATRALHSGHYGNWAPNPSLALARLLASMKDEDGRVLVDGFYDSAAPLGAAERAALAALPDVDADLRHELGLAPGATEGGGASLAERLLLPSLNLRGFDGGAVGAAAANVIPKSATASLDLRLVKGNDPEAMLDLVEAHVRRQGYFIVRQEPDLATRLAHPRIALVVRETGYPAARTALDLPIARAVVAAAGRAAGEPVLILPGLGGSLPLYLWTDRLARPAVIVPIANHDDNQHAADENLRLANLWYGIDLMAALLTMPPEAPAAAAPASAP